VAVPGGLICVESRSEITLLAAAASAVEANPLSVLAIGYRHLSVQVISHAYPDDQKLQFGLFVRLSYRRLCDCSPPITVPPEGT
jgi:hypothetical protein